jgi:hypothetical protein
MESRELMAGCRQGLGSGSRLGWDGDVMEGQGMAGDMTFHDSVRDVTRAGTGHDEDGDAQAWQGEDKDREAGTQRWQRKLDCIVVTAVMDKVWDREPEGSRLVV